MTNTQTLNMTKQQLEEALRYYCKFHLKAGDLEKNPQLKDYLPTTNN